MQTNGITGKVGAAGYFGAALALTLAPGARAETAAGTAIVNVAQLTAAGRTAPIASNSAVVIVAERLDVTLTPGPAPAPNGSDTVVAAILTNSGNGRETFDVTATAPTGDTRIIGIAIDGDGDGRYDPARDPAIVDGRTPVLEPGRDVTLFILVGGGGAGALTIDATAATGSGAPGSGFPGAGDGGGDAVTGATGGTASTTIMLTPRDPAAPTLAKSASVTATDGSTRASRGATITYTLMARFPAATSGIRIIDAIPAGTAYAPASLRLDDAPLSDAADGDAGDAAAGGISVALPDQPAGAIRTVRFQVVIQ